MSTELIPLKQNGKAVLKKALELSYELHFLQITYLTKYNYLELSYKYIAVFFALPSGGMSEIVQMICYRVDDLQTIVISGGR